jgi:predicted ATPase
MGLASVLQCDISHALKSGHDAVAHAEQLQQPHSTCYGLSFLAGAHLLCRDPHAVTPILSRCVSLAQEHGFSLWIAAGQWMGGWARLERGDARQALAELRLGIEALEQTGALIWVPLTRYLLATALFQVDQPDGAVEIVNEELLKLADTSGRWYKAELHRIKGNIERARGEFAAAETCYETAIAVAESQGAALWQLRAENDLASLRCAQGRSAEARARLAPLYASLCHDVESKDLLTTEALLSGPVNTGNLTGRDHRQIDASTTLQ